MAVVLLSGNLNTWGNAGAFETDPSTWGFNGNDFGNTSIRSNELAHAGIYSNKVTPIGSFGILEFRQLCAGKYIAGVVGHKYLARVMVRTPTANAIASDDCEFSMENPIIPFLTSETKKTVTQAKDTWVQVEAKWVHSLLTSEIYLKLLQVDPGNSLGTGPVYIDSFEIYEYEDVDEEPPPPAEEEVDNIYLSRNPIVKNMTASGGWDALDNFRMYDDVRVEETADSGVYVSQLKIHLTPFTDGTVTFQVREAFRKILTATPSNGETDIIRLTDRIKLFKHFTGEVDGVDETPVSLTESTPNIVMMGGLSKYKFAEIDFFGTYLPTNKNFMTWAPTTKPVDRNQDDYLNFFIYDVDTVTLKLKLLCYYDDDTTETDTSKTITGVLYGQLYQIPAGPNNSGALLVNPAKTLVKYDLSILDQSDVVISEVRTYVLDSFTHPRKRLFMFLNSLGAFEILRFTGMAETQVDVSKEEIVKFLPVTYEQADGEREVNNATMRTSGSYGSGLFDDENAAAWLDYMKDFLLSKRVYLIDGSALIPVVVQGGTFPMNADQVYEKAIRFTAINSYQEENYTPETI